MLRHCEETCFYAIAKSRLIGLYSRKETSCNIRGIVYHLAGVPGVLWNITDQYVYSFRLETQWKKGLPNYSALPWQKEASDISDISCKRGKLVCHFYTDVNRIIYACLYPT